MNNSLSRGCQQQPRVIPLSRAVRLRFTTSSFQSAHRMGTMSQNSKSSDCMHKKSTVTTYGIHSNADENNRNVTSSLQSVQVENVTDMVTQEDPTNHRPERRVMDYRSYLLRAPKRREDFRTFKRL